MATEEILLHGNFADMPVLAPGQPVYCNDKRRPFIGTEDGNKQILTMDDLSSLTPQNLAAVYAMLSQTSIGPEIPPTTPSAMDDEFNGSVLDPKWTKTDNNNHTLYFQNGFVSIQAASSNNTEKCVLITQPMPADASWEFRAAITMQASTYAAAGMVIRDSGTGKFIFAKYKENGSGLLTTSLYTNLNSCSSEPNGVTVALPTIYLRITYDGTNFYFYYWTGISGWTLYATLAKTSWMANPNQIGIGFNDYTTFAYVLGCGWFRRIA